MNKNLLLVVDEAFSIKRLGLILMPNVDLKLFEGISITEKGFKVSVRLVRPDTTEEMAEATIYRSHANVTGTITFWELACTLPETTKEQVPRGTEIWLLEDF